MAVSNLNVNLDYNILDGKSVSVANLWEWHLPHIVDGISRKLSFRKRIKNPWKISVQEYIIREVFVQWYRVLREFQTEHGRTLTKTERKYTISFNHYGTFKFHFTKLSGNSVDLSKKFIKEDKLGNRAKVVATTRKPIIITYDVRKALMTININYEVTNKYGNVM